MAGLKDSDYRNNISALDYLRIYIRIFACIKNLLLISNVIFIGLLRVCVLLRVHVFISKNSIGYVERNRCKTVLDLVK